MGLINVNMGINLGGYGLLEGRRVGFFSQHVLNGSETKLYLPGV